MTKANLASLGYVQSRSGDDVSKDRQIESIMSYARNMGLGVPRVFVETKRPDGRAALEELVGHCRDNPRTNVIVDGLSKLAREPIELLKRVEELKASGAVLHVVDGVSTNHPFEFPEPPDAGVAKK